MSQVKEALAAALLQLVEASKLERERFGAQAARWAEERLILRQEVLDAERAGEVLASQIETMAENRGLEFKSSQGALNVLHQRLLELEAQANIQPTKETP